MNLWDSPSSGASLPPAGSPWPSNQLGAETAESLWKAPAAGPAPTYPYGRHWAILPTPIHDTPPEMEGLGGQ